MEPENVVSCICCYIVLLWISSRHFFSYNCDIHYMSSWNRWEWRAGVDISTLQGRCWTSEGTLIPKSFNAPLCFEREKQYKYEQQIDPTLIFLNTLCSIDHAAAVFREDMLSSSFQKKSCYVIAVLHNYCEQMCEMGSYSLCNCMYSVFDNP